MYIDTYGGLVNNNPYVWDIREWFKVVENKNIFHLEIPKNSHDSTNTKPYFLHKDYNIFLLWIGIHQQVSK